MSYRVGIIGCGRVAGRFDDDPKRRGVWTHAGAYEAIPKVKVIAAADVDPGALRSFCARWRVQNGYADYRAMLHEASLDVLSICTPPDSHAEIAIAAAQAGVRAIWCEKPMAASVEQARRMLDACAARSVVCAVNHVRRWDPCWQQANALVASGAIGSVQAVTAVYSGGIGNIGSHVVDLLRFLMGDATWVQAHVRSSEEPDPPISGMIGFSNGVIAHLAAGDPAAFLVFELDILGGTGRLRVVDNGTRLELWQTEEGRRYSGLRELVLRKTTRRWKGERFVNAAADVVRCLEQGGAPACTGEDGLKALELVDAFRQSADGACRISLPVSSWVEAA